MLPEADDDVGREADRSRLTAVLRLRKSGSCHGAGDGDRRSGHVYHEADGVDDRGLSRTGDLERDRTDVSDRARSRTLLSVLVLSLASCIGGFGTRDRTSNHGAIFRRSSAGGRTGGGTGGGGVGLQGSGRLQSPQS